MQLTRQALATRAWLAGVNGSRVSSGSTALHWNDKASDCKHARPPTLSGGAALPNSLAACSTRTHGAGKFWPLSHPHNRAQFAREAYRQSDLQEST